jgi:hypothetical protein
MSNVGWQELDWAEDVTVAEMSKEQGARSKEQEKIAILWEL